jgi:vacuolar-type H+-ATPase subunit C/Vma6
LQRYVRQRIDIENAWAALALVGEAAPNDLGDPFIPGGQSLSRADFDRAIKSPNAGAAARIIATSFGRRALGAVFERHAAEPHRLEEAVLDWVISQLRREVLLSPLGPAPVIRYVLELRRECQRLRRIVWEVYLGLTAPRSPSAAAR